MHTFEGKMLHKICAPNSTLHHCSYKFSISHTHTHQIDNYSGKTLTRRTESEVHENLNLLLYYAYVRLNMVRTPLCHHQELTTIALVTT